MRNDFKYPYRVTTRSEERDLNNILYGILSFPFILPLVIIHYFVRIIVDIFFPNSEGGIDAFLTLTIYFILFVLLLEYVGWLDPILKFLSLFWDHVLNFIKGINL